MDLNPLINHEHLRRKKMQLKYFFIVYVNKQLYVTQNMKMKRMKGKRQKTNHFLYHGPVEYLVLIGCWVCIK